MPTETSPLKEWANNALAVQDACNASGVAHSLVRWFASEACDTHCGSTGERNNHPITRLYVAKLADLAGVDYTWPSIAYREVQELTE